MVLVMGAPCGVTASQVPTRVFSRSNPLVAADCEPARAAHKTSIRIPAANTRIAIFIVASGKEFVLLLRLQETLKSFKATLPAQFVAIAERGRQKSFVRENHLG